MQKEKLPLMYHPTNVLLVDDQPVFLNQMCENIDHNIPYVTAIDPEQALAYLRTHTYLGDIQSLLVAQPNFNNVMQSPTSIENFDIDFSTLRRDLDSPERFKKITVVFVDQSMPKMEGLDFCRRVRKENLLVKLILLTGNAGLDKAVDAFNEGIVDAYIPKDHPNLIKVVNEHIRRYSWLQFMELSDRLAGLISHIIKPLYDEKFFEIFSEIWQKQQEKGEFYLMDSSCSFLFLNDDLKKQIFFVRNECDFNEIYELAKNSEAPYSVLEAIRGRQKFPITPDPRGYLKLQGDAWEDVMEFMSKVPGRELYYALVDRPGMEVFSFKRYFNEVWPQP